MLGDLEKADGEVQFFLKAFQLALISQTRQRSADTSVEKSENFFQWCKS